MSINVEEIWNNVTSNVTAFFSPPDNLPWTDPQMIEACERDVLDAGQQAALRENLMKLAWALVHSRRQPDVRRGLAILQEQLRGEAIGGRKHEVYYLMAVGYFRLDELPASRQNVETALELSPQSLQAQRLKSHILSKIKSDGMIGLGIAGGVAAATAAVVVAAVAASARR